MTAAFATLPGGARAAVPQHHAGAVLRAVRRRRCSGSPTLGRAELATLVGRVDLALGDSDYNRRELEALGFAPTGVMPLAVDIDRLATRRRRPALETVLGDGLVNILFVGRIAPNKKIEDHIRLAEHYKRYVDTDYRFIFVGRTDARAALLRRDPRADARDTRCCRIGSCSPGRCPTPSSRRTIGRARATSR